MKLAIAGIYLFLLAACGTSQNVETNTEGTSTTIEENVEQLKPQRIIGYVKLDKVCDVYIDAEIEPGIKKRLYPINLDEKFKIDGILIKFDYNFSRAAAPGGCDCDYTISVHDVAIMR